jgi:hypothetical protein
MSLGFHLSTLYLSDCYNMSKHHSKMETLDICKKVSFHTIRRVNDAAAGIE